MNRQLIWCDEFDYDGVPDPTKWAYETGMLRNEEFQLYTARPENVRVESGRLILEGRAEKIRNPQYDPASDRWNACEFASFTSGSISTLGLGEWPLGRVEVRAKIPSFSGSWPAIWLMGADIKTYNWPRCGEIDIMEHVGKEPQFVHASVHRPAHPRENGTPKEKLPYRSVTQRVEVDINSPDAPWNSFHVYAAERVTEPDGDFLDFYYDDRRYLRYDLDLPADDPSPEMFRGRQFLKLNLALGGGWGRDENDPTGRGIDISALPARFEIDYVRVFS